MIPWVREKFAERRARWIASRKRESGVSSSNSTNSSQKGGEKQNSTSKLKSEDSKQPAAQSSGLRENFRKVKVISPFGKMIILQMEASAKIYELKQEALQKLSEDSGALPLFATDIRQIYPKYRLVRPDCHDSLNESLSLIDARVYDNELFVVTLKRTTYVNDLDNMRGPTEQEISSATRNVPAAENKPPRVDINELVLQSDLQFDVRKVLISLAQASAYVIGAGPFAPRLISMLTQKLINKRKHQNDTLQCLVDMGFDKDVASYALKLKNGVYSAALDYLIEHQNENNTSLPDDSSTMTKSCSRLSHSSNISENIEALLEIVRVYSQREIAPPPETVLALVGMGFDEKQVRNALKVTRNNQAAACEWLCGNRSVSLSELREGLSPESPILKAMMESPQVQMSLSNPKIFIAYLSMLDNQNALSMWLGDSDTSSVLSHILRKYHEEKHILGINQFNSVR